MNLITGSDFEFRAYDGAPAQNSVLVFAMSALNILLKKLKINTLSPIKSQLQGYLGTIELDEQLKEPISAYLEGLDPDLCLPRIEGKLMEGTFKYLGVKYSIRVNLDGDWEIAFADDTFDLIPGTDSPFDAPSNQIQFRVNLDRFVLLSFGVDVQYWNPVADNLNGAWLRLKKFDLLDGSKLSGVHASILLSPVIDQSLYELISESGQKFRPVILALTGFGLSNDHTDFDVGGDVPDWIMDGLNYVASHIYGGLNFYQAVANKVMRDVEAKVHEVWPSNLPPLLDFPVEATYGQAFGRSPEERATFRYHPEIDIIGGENGKRTILFRHRQRKWHLPTPAIIEPGDLFDPGQFSLSERLKDYININGYLADIFNINIPIPHPEISAIKRDMIIEVVQQFAEPPVQARDQSVLNLLKDEVPSAVISSLRWEQIDFSKQSIIVNKGHRKKAYKISSGSVKALKLLQRQQTAFAAVKRKPKSDPTNFVFITPHGRPIGERGVLSLWLGYVSLSHLISKLPVPWRTDHSDNPPLPTIIDDYPMAIAYAVNFIVPNLQFGFLHAAGGLNLNKTDFHTVDFVDYSPFSGIDQDFSVQIKSPQSQPLVNFFTDSTPLLNMVDLPVELKIAGNGEQPLQAKVNIAAGIKPDFQQCSNCILGKEKNFLTLVQNLTCLAELGLIELKGNLSAIMQCLIHPYPITLVHDGQVVVQTVTVENAGSFPSGSLVDAAWLAELNALIMATLPRVLIQMIPIPVLFDLFHLIPQNNRDKEHQILRANYGWMTLIQPIAFNFGSNL